MEARQRTTQKWDAAGRRKNFGVGDFEQKFGYRGDGLVSQINLPKQNKSITYAYGVDGLLSSRNHGTANQIITRDNLGRIK